MVFMKSSLTVGVDGGGTVALVADLDLDEPPVHPVSVRWVIVAPPKPTDSLHSR